jgi:hypothetical protein
MRLWEQPELARSLYAAIRNDLAKGIVAPQVRVMHPDSPPTREDAVHPGPVMDPGVPQAPPTVPGEDPV